MLCMESVKISNNALFVIHTARLRILVCDWRTDASVSLEGGGGRNVS